VIHITNCRPYPEVSSVAVGQSVTVYNVDAKAHTLKDSAGSGFSLALPAKGTQTFTLKASNETGFTYACDGTAAGVVVTAK
jgi:plastocyanin